MQTNILPTGPCSCTMCAEDLHTSNCPCRDSFQRVLLLMVNQILTPRPQSHNHGRTTGYNVQLRSSMSASPKRPPQIDTSRILCDSRHDRKRAHDVQLNQQLWFDLFPCRTRMLRLSQWLCLLFRRKCDFNKRPHNFNGSFLVILLAV